MKTSRIASILAAAALTTTLWASAAMALSFDITGYTAGIDVLLDGSSDVNGGPAGPADTFLNGAGQYTIHFTGADYSNLKASLSLVGDMAPDATTLNGFKSSVESYYSGILNDTYSITWVNSIFTLSNQDGAMMSLNLAGQANIPDVPVNYTSALANIYNGQQYAYVNRVYEYTGPQDSQGVPAMTYESYGLDGLLTTPTTGYGLIIAPFDTFIGTTASGTFIDMTIEDANVPVPEPGTFILFGAGVAGLAFWRRRKA